MTKKKSIKPRQHKWQIEISNLSREVLLEADGNIKLTDRRAGGRQEIERFPWHELLKKRTLWDHAVESELLLFASKNLEVEGDLDKQEQPRATFWRQFDPERIEALTERASAAEFGSEHELRSSQQGLHCKRQYSSDETLARWDEVYFHGPLVGGTSQAFRRRLREMLLGALDDNSAIAHLIFPLLDYDLLPTTSWELGSELQGSRSYFKQEHFVHVAWDNRGRPEGGRMDYSIEKLFTGGIRYATAIPDAELKTLLERARIS